MFSSVSSLTTADTLEYDFFKAHQIFLSQAFECIFENVFFFVFGVSAASVSLVLFAAAPPHGSIPDRGMRPA